jgi:hypothetical protein
MNSKRFPRACGINKAIAVLITLFSLTALSAFGATAASITSPLPGSTLTSTAATFTWNGGTGIQRYRLQIGTSWATYEFYNGITSSRSATVRNLPANGSTIYVQISSQASSGYWMIKRYTYTAYKQAVTPPTPIAAVINSPVPGSTLTGTSASFSWSTGSGVSQFSLSVGSTSGSGDIYSNNLGSATATSIGNIPQDGRTIYVTLGSLISGVWKYNNYTYVAPTATASNPTGCSSMGLGQGASLNGFRPFPSTNPWNQDISASPVDSNSATIINAIGSTAVLHADFGAGTWNGAKVGIPYVIVDSSQPKGNVVITTYPGESDQTSMPIPATAPIEGYPNDGDRHVIVLDKSNCWEYDLFYAANNSGVWSAAGSAVWDLQNYESRPYTWSSADASGLPIFPGLVRYDEVSAGAINHAIRVTVPRTRPSFVLPATHWASTNTSSPVPMGTRLRLKASYNISSFSAANQVILNAMKKYGLLVTDNGSAMFFSGAPDDRWNNDDLHKLGGIPASAFEVIQLGTQYSASNVPQGSAPSISGLTASAMSVASGTPVTLSWNATGASYYFVTPQAGPVRGNSVVVNPIATTTYTLTATNAYGRTTASITINVQ